MFITILTKWKGYMWGEKQEKIKHWMLTTIEKKNFSNNEWKVCDAYAICTFHIDKKIDVFKIDDPKIVMCSYGI